MSGHKTDTGRQQTGIDIAITFGLALIVLFFMGTTYLAYHNIDRLKKNNKLVSRTHTVLYTVDQLTISLRDAETGQRGFLLTGNQSYLAPYQQALPQVSQRYGELQELLASYPEERKELIQAKVHIDDKMAELNQTIALRRDQGFGAALAVVNTNLGKGEMDSVRALLGHIRDQENDIRDKLLQQMSISYRMAFGSSLLAGFISLLVSAAIAALILNANGQRRARQWLQTGTIGLASVMVGEQNTEKLCNSILKYLCDYLNAPLGVLYIRGGAKGFRRAACYGVASPDALPESFAPGEGLPGQAVIDQRSFIIDDVPEQHFPITTALGRSVPRHIAILPTISEQEVNAVIELGFILPVSALSNALLAEAANMISVALRSAEYQASLQNFLEETQRQSEELQAQSEELRVSNEELEEQSRALKETQSRLEQQQAELEQNNAQLEEQSNQLETQRDDIQTKADELERASQYKSDFLANMSHELRTPLNSTLILAKLLADNREGNLNDEQVKYAETIQTSGNDLLTLIDEILDLSKIEAGHFEIVPERVRVSKLVQDIQRVFEPIARQKSLSFKVEIAPGCPDQIETDRMRLEQILKNLLSNAFKFTRAGQVSLTVSTPENGTIAFSVRDTGIGIPLEQQELIFDAFRQADSKISRKYGGTGLGLSISRELARLLGGAIAMHSVPEEGSVFTVTLRETHGAVHADDAPPLPKPAPALRENRSAGNGFAARPEPREDDRGGLDPSKHTILIVEDDKSFAEILNQTARDLNFQCLMATTAQDALVTAREYLPDAVLLDVGLPDHSGLAVLDQIKRDPKTRHIPVHIVSAQDYGQKALSLGAVGYLLKPVQLNTLTEALKNLESKISQGVKRLLIVEDDRVQRESLVKLLGTPGVETVAVGTASECLERLGEKTFDCMVLDLSLPDASGYSLLETLSQEESYSFPPVIVYTGRELSADEEQQLRRYSKSIIIKGAKSPERLLDEVTLFLHQIVSELPPEQQKMIQRARNRDAMLEGRRILVVEDDIRNIYSLTKILEPRGAIVQIARNGLEAISALEGAGGDKDGKIDLVLMDVMMPEMDGITATREIRKRRNWKKLPIIMLTAKAMKDDQERCIEAGASDYMAKPLDIEKLLSLVRIWMPR